MNRVIEVCSTRQRVISLGLGWLAILLLNHIPAAHARTMRYPPFRQEIRALAPGLPIERELASGETHSYRLTLALGDCLVLAVTERGPDLVVTLVGPTGQKMAESNNTISRLELLSVVTETGGEFRLDVRLADKAANKAAAGHYEVKITERRAATANDRERVRAERAFEAGEHLLAQGTTEARREAVRRYEEALSIQRAVGEKRGEAFTLYGLGLAHYHLAERRNSLEYYQQALPLVRELGERKAEAWTLVEIGYAWDYLGEKQKALDWFNQALLLLRDLGERSYEAFALASIGLVYSALGDRQQSLTYHQQALTIRRRLGDREGEAISLAFIGNNYEALGEKQKAVEYLHQAVAMMRAVGAMDTKAQVLYSLGLIYDSLNEREKAVEYFNQALTIRKAVGHPRNKISLHLNLGNIYEGLRDYQQALAHYQQALALSEEQKDYRSVGRTLRNLGLVHYAIGEKQKSIEVFKRALALLRFGWDRQTYARALTNLGKILSETGDYEQALTHLNEALALQRKLNSRFFEAATLYLIARSERGRGNLLEAHERNKEALSLIERLRGGFYQTELRAVGFTKAQDVYELEIDLLVRLNESQTDRKLIDAALEISEQSRARTMLDLLAESRIEIRQGISEQLKRREQESQSRLSALQSQLIQAHQEPKPDARRIRVLQEELNRADAEREALESEIRRFHPRYAEILYPAPLGADAIREMLDPQTALLEYTLGQETSFLFVVTRESVSCFRLPKAADISQVVEELRAAIKSPGRREFASYERAAGRLYQMLIAPAESALGTKQKLLIVPNGALYYLPFEALLAKGTGAVGRANDYLLKRWAISYAPSASVLASLRQNRRAAPDRSAKEFLAFADPVYRPGEKIELLGGAGKKEAPENATGEVARGLFDQGERLDLTRLNESSREATEIARLYGPDQVALYVGSEAKEENVKGNPTLASARRIHFATHSLTSERKPQYSGLVLTLDDDPREDGLLQVYEIFNLKLQADLVVLSACHTALGKQLKGEGMIGLTRAFMYAGAPSVVVSLWQVADRSTAELMVKFYQQLDLSGDKAEALRQAKLKLMENPRYGHPYYWAPFVLVGETR